MTQFSFRRPDLAKSFCESLRGTGVTDARFGLFLAARRRVGKSTFLREDLVPEMLTRNWLPVYVDLWKDSTADPAVLLGDVIKQTLIEFDGLVMKAARAMHLTKVGVGGALTLDLAKPGLSEGVTLADALLALHKKAGKPVALIVDEAQHALTSEKGSSAMFGLKAARDQLNSSYGEPALMLVMTGSNRDKLAHLVLHKSQPFYGSRVTPFPLLGRDFTDAYTDWVNHGLSEHNQLLRDDVSDAFLLVGQRPQILRDIIGDVIQQGEAAHLGDLVRHGATEWHDRIWGEFEGAYGALTPLQKAIMQVLVRQGNRFSPFTEDSMKAYREVLGENELSTSTIQTSLETLRERELVWREARGAYALEDDAFAEWLNSHAASAKR
jgi:hypothetical protein